MTIVFHAAPKQQITITHSATNYQFEDVTATSTVVRRENAASYATITSKDSQWLNMIDRCDIADHVKIEYKYEDGTDTYTQVFGGYIRELLPSTSMEGDILTINALGYGVALANMIVREEYGEQSRNSTEKTITDILTDATIGIIPQYVNKVMKTATNSGYSIDTTEIAALANDYQYLYFAKPAIKCLEDLIDLYRAAKVPNAGAHWIIVPSGTTAYLCIGTVGSHEAGIVDKWPTWYDTDATNSTLEVGVHNIVTDFHKVRAEANYVLYSGNFRKPATGDAWTENVSGDWDTYAAAGSIALADDSDAADVTTGSYSLRADYNGAAGQAGYFFYPGTHDAQINLTKIESPLSVPFVKFDVKRNSHILTAGAPGVPFFLIGTGDPALSIDAFYVPLNNILGSVAADKWVGVTLPIGNYYDMALTNDSQFYSTSSTKFVWHKTGGPFWSDIDWVGFYFVDDGTQLGAVHVDGLHIGGKLTRVAWDSTKVASKNCRMISITDDVPKDDTLVEADDSGMIAQFAKAELARAAYEPWVGEIEVPLLETLLPGQKMHIHHCKKSDGTFRVDDDFRVIQVIHTFTSSPNGCRSRISLTDDLKNSYPYHPSDQYNILFKAVAPAFQDRMRASLTSKDIDIMQTILKNDYNTAGWD